MNKVLSSVVSRLNISVLECRCYSSTKIHHHRPIVRASLFSTDSTSSNHSSDLSKLNKNKIGEEILQYWMVAEMKSPAKNCNSRRARYCCYTYHDAKREYESSDSAWHWLDRELSSNLAGETGAVYIYKGAMAALDVRSRFADDRNEQSQLLAARQFCDTHHCTEDSHRRFFEAVIPDGKRTCLLPLWTVAGFSLGFWPTLVGGPNALYITVEAVENFVVEHFQNQIVPLRREQNCPELLKLLEACCEDEVHHREDAARQLLCDDASYKPTSWWVRSWTKTVHAGSSLAAEVARRV